MKLIDWIVVAVIVIIIGAVVWYLHRAKKKGVKCIGCPDSGKCSGKCSGCAGYCGCKEKSE